RSPVGARSTQGKKMSPEGQCLPDSPVGQHASRLAAVSESPLANKTTSCPIATSSSDAASPNSTARELNDSPCATTRGRTYRQNSRGGVRASTNMVEVLNPTVREPWQKLKEYFMN